MKNHNTPSRNRRIATAAVSILIAATGISAILCSIFFDGAILPRVTMIVAGTVLLFVAMPE